MNLDALLNPDHAGPKVGVPCRVSRIISALEEPYQSAARKLAETRFEDGGLSAPKVAAKFAEAGITVSATTLSHHRNGWCPCPGERNAT
ncbi:hypothetical protein UFOVP609_49 [uncultured Caudovirales phage]|uniref:Uncharacterized protein n=1 Tax=uncultured Caudovirales phage TaxID=2100421 RepID=A0A6J5N706_9CAUD|nr:hypothetical protein UFOVP609_49 [uncultured Caudovirales phage]